MATPLTLQSGVGSNSAGGALTLLPGISEGTNKAGANLTLNGGQGTGTGTGGSIIFKVADGGIGSSANTNTLQKALEIKDNGEIVSSGSHYIASAANASWGGLEVSPTLTFTGSTSVTNASPINMVSLSAPTLSCGSAINVDTAASLYVAGAPSTGGSLTISNSYSLFVDAGTTRLDGGLNLAGTLVTATAAELNLVDSSSAGTIVNSKAVIYGASGEVNATTLQIGGSSITSTATELNILDGDASPGTDAVSGTDGIVVNDATVMKQTSVDTFDTYLSGTTKTLTNKTLTAPKIANGGFIADANGNEQIVFTTTASAVNELTIANAAAGNSPSFTATGGDSDIGITLSPKGSGAVTIFDAELDVESYAAIGNGSALSANSGLIIDYDKTFTGVGQQLLVKGTVTGAANTSFYGASIEPEGCTVPSGTTSLVASLRVKEPTLTATGTLTTAATVYIEDAPTEAGSNYALLVDAGTTRLDGDVSLGNDLSLTSDSSVINFGESSEIKLTHVADEGLTLKHTATSDNKPIKLTLQTGETDIAENDKIGVIDFQAPDEGTGTDARLVCAGIEAVSEGDFAANNNATKLSFKTAAGETASEKMKLSSAGVLTVNNTIVSGFPSSTTGSLMLYSSGNTNTTKISAGANPTNSINYVLPEDGPPDPVSQYFLTSTTNGTMSWATNALGGGGGGGGGSTTNIYFITDNVNSGGTTGLVIDGSGVPSFTATNTNTLYNVGLGYSVFATNTTGGYNTLMGYSVGNSIVAGSSNTLIGSGAGGTLATGNNNTCLGYNASVSASDVNNEITLGNSSVTDLRCADTSIASLSDARDKTDIIDLPWGLDFVDSLRPVQFTWDRRVITPDDENWPMNGKKRAGFIAQELQASMTDNANDVLDLVYESNPERLEVKQGKLVPMLTQAIKELKAELDTLKAEVATLKNASN
jgi:hypothetical protein